MSHSRRYWTSGFQALGDRAQACGPGDAYPFDISQHGLQLRGRPSPYLFQLLVSLGFTDDHHDGTTVYKLFEELSATAAGRYLGDIRTAVVFGAPRRDLPAGFRDAVAHLANLLREGKASADRENLSHSKDDGLDVVAWKEFPDRRASKLILFGQCAVGRHWKKKTHDLQPGRWCKRNFARTDRRGPDSGFLRPKGLVGTRTQATRGPIRSCSTDAVSRRYVWMLWTVNLMSGSESGSRPHCKPRHAIDAD